jgi:hypothetical protein
MGAVRTLATGVAEEWYYCEMQAMVRRFGNMTITGTVGGSCTARWSVEDLDLRVVDL